MTTTNTLVLLLTVAVMATTTVEGVFRMRRVSVRSRPYGSTNLQTVLKRLDHLTSLVTEMQASVDDLTETVNVINATLDPPVVRK